MKWIDGAADFVRVISFDFLKAFDMVSRRIVIDKRKSVPGLNP